MALPSSNQVTVPIAGQNLTIQYKNENLIGDAVAPIVPVYSPATKILKYAKANMFMLQDDDLWYEEGGEVKVFNYDIESQTVNPRFIASGEDVYDSVKDVVAMPGQMPLQPDIDAVQHAFMKQDLKKELLVSQAIYGATWSDGTSGGSVPSAGAAGWAIDGTANSFIKDIYAAKSAILGKTGKKPNTLVLDYGTFIAQQFNPVIADKIKYTQRGVITTELLASVLQLDEVLVGEAIYTSQNQSKKPGNAFTGTQIWSPSGADKGNAFLYYRGTPGLRVVSALFQFRLPVMGQMRYVRSYRIEPKALLRYEVKEKIDMAVLATDVGYAWKTCIKA
jgi:hypothetical protein